MINGKMLTVTPKLIKEKKRVKFYFQLTQSPHISFIFASVIFIWAPNIFFNPLLEKN